MVKKSFSITTVLLVAILAFILGVLVNKLISPAAFSAPFLANTTPSVRTCVDKKCVVVNNQCSTDNNCATHMQCNDQKKCVVVNGAGANQCSANIDCAAIKDPQAWCKAHNTGVGVTSTAIKYPNGNFSCDCYYLNKDGTHSQTSCSNSHLQ